MSDTLFDYASGSVYYYLPIEYDSSITYSVIQTFIPSITHKITSVKLTLKKVGNPSGGLSIQIVSGLGTGAVLSSGSISSSSLTTSFAVYEIVLTPSDSANNSNIVQKSGLYSILIHGDTYNGTDGSNYYYAGETQTSTYANGQAYLSTNGGSFLTQDGDLVFSEYGTLLNTSGLFFCMG
jgi:hypothetical protein